MAKANASQAVERAQQLIQAGQFRSATKITEQLVRAFPKNTQILLMHASTLIRCGRYQQLISVLTPVIDQLDQKKPEYALAIITVANAYTMMGDIEHAAEILQHAFEASSDQSNSGIAAMLIDRYLDLDDLPSAQRILDTMNIGNHPPVDLHPSLACSWARAMKSQLDTNEIIASLEPIAHHAENPYTLSLMIGRLLEDAGEYDRAIEHYQNGNRSNPPTHNREQTQARVDQIRGTFTKDTLGSLSRPKHRSDLPRPIIIVGMPRSGTSLVEQIIRAHPDISAAGESQLIPEIVGQMTAEKPQGKTTRSLEELRSFYLEELMLSGCSDTQPKFITDKNPMNLFYLGHALAFIPDAIMVRVQRDPRDICLSCFSSPLATDHTYKFDLDDCAHFVSGAHKTLEHFKPIFQADTRATWIDVSYEELTKDPVHEITKLFESLGIEPHPDCFTFHTSKRAIQTISRDQVREPMNTKSVARWQNFAHIPQFQTMISRLNADNMIQ